MRLFKIKIKSTGVVFLGPILGAFVEEEKRGFEKKKKVEQMTVLAAGVFANIVFALIFYLLYVGFFFSSFTASGYIFTSYGLDVISVDKIGVFTKEGEFMKFIVEGKNYYLDENLLKQLNVSGVTQIVAYQDAPAFKVKMKGAIISADDVKINNHEDLRMFLENKNPGDMVKFVTETDEGTQEYNVVLASHPDDSARAYLGVGHNGQTARGVIGNVLSRFMSFKDPSTYYKPTWDGGLVIFIFQFLWWIMVINLLVALFNMLPLGILDGGRFFYLLVWGITGSEKFGRGAYKWAGRLILLMFLLMMFYWAIGIV